MEYVRFIVLFLLLDIHSIHCQTTTTTPNFVYNCSFLNNTYNLNSAVANQFTYLNRTSIILTAYYAFVSPSVTISTYDLGLIYPFATTNYLVPFPLFLNCTSMIQSCLLERIAGTGVTSRDGEPINVSSSSINYTFGSNQRVFYLGEGQYQLSNCLFNNGQTITDNQTKFSIQIRYEKTYGTLCNPSSNTCGSSNLTTCSLLTSKCTCLSSNLLVNYLNSSFCADTLNTSGCTIFPKRCITWCNSTSNDFCICPSDTLKIQRDNLYVCELPVNAINCTSNDSIRRCPYGQICVNQQCINNIITTTANIITTTSNESNNSNLTDERLRIALGVIAGLLGTSLIILFGVFCWLRQRQKRARMNAEKSLSPSSSSMTSSLYISPIQQQDQQSRKHQSIYHHSINQRFSPIYRSDSFRQAILSGHHQQMNTYFIERVSTKLDNFSFINDDYTPRSYNALDYPNPNQNIYQTIIPPSTPSILTHSV